MMNNLSPVKYRTIQVMSILAALVFAAPALAEGCSVSALDPEQIVDVGEFDGNMSCSDWPSMASSNCFLDPEEGGDAVSCMIETDKGDITVSATKNNGAINWTAVSVDGLGIDKVILDNANKANGCLQNNKFDTTKGSIVFIKSNGDPQPSQGAEFCADNIVSAAPTAPQVASPLPSCSAANYTLDDTTIICPKYSQAEWDAADADCSPDDMDCPDFSAGDEKPVVVCNLEKDKPDWGTTDGTDVCCQCGIPESQQTACVVTEDRDQCTQSMTVNPTQSVELTFFKDDKDPCTWIKTSRGWTAWCY